MKCAIGLCLLCCFAVSEVEAGCTAAAVASPAGYGTISSTLVRTVAQNTSSTSAGLTCTPGGIALFSTAYFKATITSAQSGMLGPTGDVIAYSINVLDFIVWAVIAAVVQLLAFLLTSLEGTNYPGDVALAEQSEKRCMDAFADFVGIAVKKSKYSYTYLSPTEQTWKSANDRALVCLAGLPNGGVTGSLRGLAK